MMYKLIGFQEESEILIGVFKSGLAVIYLGKLNVNRTNIQGRWTTCLDVDELDDLDNWEDFSLMVKERK